MGLANEESIVTTAECTAQTAELSDRFTEVSGGQPQHFKALIYLPVRVISLAKLQPLAGGAELLLKRQSVNYSSTKRRR